MVHLLPDETRKQVTILNFSQEEVTGTIRSEHLDPGSSISDMFAGGVTAGEVDNLNSFAITIPAHEGLSLLFTRPS